MLSEWTTSQGLHLPVDATGGRREALEVALRDGIRAGQLRPGARLPSTLALAADLGFARGTVTDAYEQLVAEGWLVSRQGSGTHVADVPTDRRARVALPVRDAPPP